MFTVFYIWGWYSSGRYKRWTPSISIFPIRTQSHHACQAGVAKAFQVVVGLYCIPHQRGTHTKIGYCKDSQITPGGYTNFSSHFEGVICESILKTLFSLENTFYICRTHFWAILSILLWGGCTNIMLRSKLFQSSSFWEQYFQQLLGVLQAYENHTL